jgi:lipopolysaccharide/colanic/teichoic acid biosynthesis glycosyltransferase
MPTNHTSEEAVARKQTRKTYKKEKKKQLPAKKQQTETQSTDKQTRKQIKQQHQEEKLQTKRPRRRIFPIWMRIIIVLLLCAIALIVGLMVGFGVLGDGVPEDVLKKETWQHIVDIVTKVKQ